MIMETIKIVMTSTYYPPHHFGGDAMHVYYLANELAKVGHEVDVIYNLGLYELRGSKKIGENQYLNHEGIKLHPLKVPFERFSMANLYAFGSDRYLSKQVLSIINSLKPDVLHHHNMGGLGISALNISTPCTLYTAHDYWLICPMSSLMYAGKAVCCGNSNCFYCAIKSKRPVQLWRYYTSLKKKINNIDIIITPSDYIKSILSKNFMSTRFETMYNFVPQPLEISKSLYDFPYFLFVGVLSSVKGIENLVNAFLLICNQIDAHLLIVGDGPLRTKLQQQITSSGKQDRIKLLGKVDYETLISLYKNTLATVIPSIWPENCPLVAIESLSCGTPIIAANTGGLQEIVNTSKSGILFENDDINGLSKYLIQLYENSNVRSTLKNNATKAYNDYYSPKVYINKYINIIKSVEFGELK